MPGFPSSIIASLALLAAAAKAQSYTLSLTTDLSGQSFFSGFNYNASAIDPSNFGNIHYVDQATAQSEANPLTYINSASNAIIKVDNQTSGVNNSTFGRNTVLLISKASISIGSLVVIDAVHLPFGCSVWPALWTLGQTQTDTSGEIDIWESVNLGQQGLYTLHTNPGCTQSNSSSLPFTDSTVVSTDCDHTVNANQGCSFRDSRTTTTGVNFGTGGVFAMLWSGDGIQNWFFPRDAIPADITSGAPLPANWTAPQASWPASSCNPSSFFTDQNLIINIDVCGAFAGEASVFNQTCSGTCTDLVAEPSNYDNAYFEISSIKVYTGAKTAVADSSSALALEGGLPSVLALGLLVLSTFALVL